MGYFRYNEKLDVYRRRLPHWRMENGVYFITARLRDAVSPKKIERLHSEYSAGIERLRSRNVSADAFEAFYEWFHLAVYDDALDEGHGSCALTREEFAEIIWNSIQHFDGVRYQLIAAVVMPNHIHVVFRVLPGFSFEKIVGAWKSFSYDEIRKRHGEHVLWQDECFDRLVRDERELQRVVEYVLNNPAAAGLRGWRWAEQFMRLR